MSVRRWWLSLVALLALLIATPAHAQKRDDREVNARELFALGHYAEALAIFGKLYAETSHPTYLRNIGRCYQNLGDPDKAIASFREYLRQVKNLAPDQRALVEGYVREMEELKRKQGASPAPAPRVVATPQPAPAPAPAPRAAAPAPDARAPTIAHPRTGDEGGAPDQPDGNGSRRTAAYLVAGASAASLVVGGIFGLRAISQERDSKAACPGQTCGGEALALNQKARTSARVADVTLGAGVVSLGVAAYLFWTSRGPASGSSERAATGPRLIPQLASHQVGMSASASW